MTKACPLSINVMATATAPPRRVRPSMPIQKREIPAVAAYRSSAEEPGPWRDPGWDDALPIAGDNDVIFRHERFALDIERLGDGAAING
jgi:hypothetical protein